MKCYTGRVFKIDIHLDLGRMVGVKGKGEGGAKTFAEVSNIGDWAHG